MKAFAEPEDVLNFVRKVEFARHLPEPSEAVLLAPTPPPPRYSWPASWACGS